MMTQSFTDTSSVLGIEIGTQNTRAVMFDIVEGTYHFLASGVAPSTQKAPFFDIGEGILAAITKLQLVIGRTLMDHDGNLIIPAQRNGEGVDKLFITISGGPEVKLATFGLLNEVTLESANRLAQTVYGSVKDSFGINDKRSVQDQMAALLAARPDIILFSGGTDHGASRSVVRIAQMIALVFSTLPQKNRPEILYCGNHTVAKTVVEILERQAKVTVAENIRPTLEDEDLQNSSEELSKMVLSVWSRQIEGLSRIAPLCSEPPSLSSQNYQRMMRFLGKLYDPNKAVLGIDVGSAYTTFSTSNSNKCTLSILPYGMGDGFENALNRIKVSDVEKWLVESVPQDELKAILWQKTLTPGSVPIDEKGLAIDQAATRALLEYTLKEMKRQSLLVGATFEPIFISGSTITHAPIPQQILLTILDSIQPTGVTPLIIDKHGLLPLLGAIAHQNALLPVQVMETSAFINLATVINVESKAPDGASIVNVRITYNSGSYMDLDVKQGTIATLPLGSGEVGTVTLNLSRRTVIEGLVAPSEPFKVHGGICGVVIDARGRPMVFPRDENSRREKYKRWLFMLGA